MTDEIKKEEAVDAENPSSLFEGEDEHEKLLAVDDIDQSIRLVTDPRCLNWSMYSVRFAVFASMVTSTILQPNFPFMARTGPGAHRDAFESTSPFGFNAATYFLNMTALLGTAISSTVIGSLSDRVGRKPCLLVCLAVGAVGAITNFIARKSFWGFSASNFLQGLFAGALPVAMAYVSDVRHTRKEKDTEIGILVAVSMVGAAGGGIVAILMEEQGLFAPLFVGAALNVVSTISIMFFTLEPNKTLFQGVHKTNDDNDDEDEHAPEKIDNLLLSNVITGALFDNFGSAGLVPIALSPLAFNEFFVAFVAIGEDPIMSQTAFKWISVMVALVVIPGAALSQVVFDRIGPAGGCVLGNVITGIIIIAVLYIALIEPATNVTFGGFIAALYIGFPFTVLSQLSTGPMLDALAPVDRRGYVQGLNIAVMSFANAVSPYALGELSDSVGVLTTMWTCIGISFAAALVNVPLMFSKTLRRPPKKVPKYLRALAGEDGDLVERAKNGEWVPASFLEELNDQRMRNGEPFLILPFKTYEEDKERLSDFQAHAYGDFLHLRRRMLNYLKNDLKEAKSRQLIVDQIAASRTLTKEQLDTRANELSKWFSDYLIDAGYFVDESPFLFKQMIMQAFPRINNDMEINADNIKQVSVNYVRVLNQYLDEQELTGATKAFANRF